MLLKTKYLLVNNINQCYKINFTPIPQDLRCSLENLSISIKHIIPRSLKFFRYFTRQVKTLTVTYLLCEIVSIFIRIALYV